MGMKILLLVVLLAVVAGWWFARSRRSKKGRSDVRPDAQPEARHQDDAKAATPQVATAMLSCAHCDVHVPRDEAQFDFAGMPFCSDEHRVAGPR